MRVIETTVQDKKPQSTRQRPKIIKWKGIPMMRHHSFLSTVNEIVEYSKEIDVVRVGIVGDMNSGKTTLARAIGHSVHKKAEEKFQIPFAVRIFYQEDLMDFESTLKKLAPANYVLIFDDVSFLEAKTNRQQMSAVKQAVTKIRHLDGGADVKIILIYNYHYNLGFDKYLRMADFRYFTSVGSSEIENMEKIVSNKNMPKVHQFIKMRRTGIVKKHWSVQVSPKEFFPYKWRNPFIPVLFYNNDTLRHVVTPTREFMDKICSVCATAEGSSYAAIPVDEFVKEGADKHGERTFEAAVKLKLFENGMGVYAKSVTGAKRWLDRALEKKQISLEQLMLHYGYSITKTRLRKQFSSLIEDGSKMKDKDTTAKKEPKNLF